MHPGPAAGPADHDQREPLVGRLFNGPGQLFAHHGTHAPHDERGIGHGERHAAGADHAGSHDGRFTQPGPHLLGGQSFSIGLLVDETQRIGRLQFGELLLERPVVEHLAHAIAGGDVPVVVALRTDVEAFLDIAFENGLLVARAAAATALQVRREAWDVWSS